MLQGDTIKVVPIDSIRPNKINPNKMPESTLTKLKYSIKKFGTINPIIVRDLGDDKYEIVDGEHRWKANKEIGSQDLTVKVIKATEEDVAQFILATTIKGKHDTYQTTDIVEKLSLTETAEDLLAMNLDKGKIQRKVKYKGSAKLKPIKALAKKTGRRNEEDSANVHDVSKFRRVLLFTYKPELARKALDILELKHKDINIALLLALGIEPPSTEELYGDK